MGLKRILLAGAALGLIGIAACAYIQTAEEEKTPPFIDPQVLAQNTCSGLKPENSALGINAGSNPDFSFGAPFALPADVTDHFHYEVSTEFGDAQLWFDTGLAHMANFNHDEAIAAFRKAQDIDPNCGMCFWGEGLSFGSNINAPYDAGRGAAGLVAAKKAETLRAGGSDLERALIDALAMRYARSKEGVIEMAGAYADAMDQVATSYPKDKFILSLAAEANMDTQPWDYWQAGGTVAKGRTARTLAMLEDAIKLDPDFAPAIHLYIHTTESSDDPERAEEFADRLMAQSLGVGHLVHMPSHIYLRLGRWQKSHDANVAAIAADEAYIAGSENAGFYGGVYYPHNVHFVVASSQYAGDAETALEMAEKLDALVKIDPGVPNPLAEHIAASTIFTKLLYAGDRAVDNIKEPAAAHLYLRTAWYYARGTSFVRQGNIPWAEAELKKLKAIAEAPGFSDYDDVFLAPLAGVLDVARLTLEGRIFAERGDMVAAIKRLEAATEAERKLPYFEPTWWYYPTRQTLGAMLLKDGQFEKAEKAFFQTLIDAPNNAYALHGLAEAYKAQGDSESEAYARQLFDKAWLGKAGDVPDLSQL